MIRDWQAQEAACDPEPVIEPALAADLRLHQLRASLLSMVRDRGVRDLRLRELGVLLVTLHGAIRPTGPAQAPRAGLAATSVTAHDGPRCTETDWGDD